MAVLLIQISQLLPWSHRAFAISPLIVLLALAAPSRAQTPATTTFVITSDGAPITTVRQGTLVTLTATVTAGGAPVMPGQVNFCDAAPPHCTDIHLLDTAQLSAAGVANFNLLPPAGIHTYYAVFLGTHLAGGTSTQASVSVSPYYPTATTLAQNSTGGYTVTVTGSGGSSPPTGTITFVDADDGNYVLGTASLTPRGGGGGLQFINSATFPYQPGMPQSLAVADLNGDGKPDFLMGLIADARALRVYLGNGDGSFDQAAPVPIDNNVDQIGVADFNGDGIPDLIVRTDLTIDGQGGGATGNRNPPLLVLFGNGDGTFTMGPQLVPSFATKFAIGDFNGDGLPDIAVVTNDSVLGLSSSVSLFFGNGDGTFTPGPVLAPTQGGETFTAGDFNNDGKLDLAVADPTGKLTVYYGNGDGTFTPGPVTLLGFAPSQIKAADFNNDGFLDLAVSSGGIPVGNLAGTKGSPAGTFVSLGAVSILLGHGDGTFSPTTQGPLPNLSNIFDFGDWDGNGNLGFVAGNASQTFVGIIVTLVLDNGTGNGIMSPSSFSSTDTAINYGDIATGDFDSEGRSDIVFAQGQSYAANVFLSQFAPYFSTATIPSLSLVGNGYDNVVAIYSGDSVYQPSSSSPIQVRAYPAATTLTLTSNPSTSAYGQQVVLTAVLAPDPDQNIQATGTVTFSEPSTNTILGTALVRDGVATLNVTTLPMGTHDVFAVYSGDLNFMSSTGETIQIVSGFASTTSVTASPNPAGNGQSVAIAATVTGIGLTVVPSGTVTFYDGATRIGTATLDATGHATFTTASLAVGTHSLTASFPGDNAYHPSTSAPYTETVLSSDFSIALSNPNITLATHNYATTSVTLTSIGSFQDSISLACGNLPAYATCTFTPQPATLAVAATATVSLVINTSSVPPGESGPLPAPLNHPAQRTGLALLLSPLSLLVAARRRKLRRKLMLLALASASLGLGACGANIITPVASTSPGTYTIPITATAAATGRTQTAQLTLTITP